MGTKIVLHEIIITLQRKNSRSTVCYLIHTVFLRSDAAAIIYFAATIRGRLLFEGSVYWFGKPGDTNNGWIGYKWVRQCRLLDAVSSTHSLSVLLSAVGMTHTTPALVWWPSSEIIRTRVCMCVLHLLAAATIQGWRLFHSRASDCVVTIPGQPLFQLIRAM